MPLVLHAHPFSSYCQKVQIALYENATPFSFAMLGEPESFARLAALWPHRTFPVLEDEGRAVVESSIIIEYLALHHPGPVRLIPDDPAAALPVRFLDRVFDTTVMAPMQAIVGDALRQPDERSAKTVADARAKLDTAYAWLEGELAGRTWAAGDAFTLADCAAAPALFYADWARPLDGRFPVVAAYRARLLARPSFARCVEEARPFRAFFPLGAPDRD